MLAFVITASACAQKKDPPKTNPFLVVYAADPYRQNVPDSLKYLIPELDSILETDQYYRWGTVNNPKGKEAQEKAMAEFLHHKKEVHEADSLNIIKVSAILDRYGWLDKHAVGFAGNNAIFMVIQHADSATQEKYMPMIKQAVLEKKEQPFHYALLADRLWLKKDQLQLYGTQLMLVHEKETRYFFFPIKEPEHLIERRAELGLEPASLNNYLKSFNLTWNLETYQKELPHVQELMAASKKNKKS